MIFESIVLSNRLFIFCLVLVAAWCARQLPIFILIAAMSVLIFFDTNYDGDGGVISTCEISNTETSCYSAGNCPTVEQTLANDFEWSRYRRNVCAGIQANNKRLLQTYSTDNCEMWGGCNDKKCTEMLKDVHDKIKDFKCPFKPGDFDKSSMIYDNINEEKAFLFPGEQLMNDTTGLMAIGLVLITLVNR